MLKVKVDRETMVKAIEWHARDKEGLTPVIADDGDLCDWARWVLATVSSYDAEQLDGAGLLVTFAGDAITIGAPAAEAIAWNC
jgi:hypothetical protein